MPQGTPSELAATMVLETAQERAKEYQSGQVFSVELAPDDRPPGADLDDVIGFLNPWAKDYGLAAGVRAPFWLFQFIVL